MRVRARPLGYTNTLAKLYAKRVGPRRPPHHNKPFPTTSPLTLPYLQQSPPPPPPTMSRRLNTQTGSTPTALPAYEPPILPLTKTALDTLSTKIPKTHDGIETHIAYALRALTASASELGSLTHSKGPEDATKPQREQKLAELEAAARTVLDAAARLEASKGVVKQLARDEIQRADETEENRVQARGAAEEEDEDADPEGGDDYRPVAVQEGVWGRYKSLCESQAEEYMAKSEKEKWVPPLSPMSSC